MSDTSTLFIILFRLFSSPFSFSLSHNNIKGEADRLLSESVVEFRATSEGIVSSSLLSDLFLPHLFSSLLSFIVSSYSPAPEMRVALTCSELALNRGDVDRAIGLLSVASPDKPYFVQALTTMANVSSLPLLISSTFLNVLLI